MRKIARATLLSLGILVAGLASAQAQTTDGETPSSVGASKQYQYVYNGTSWDRLRTPLIFKQVNAVVITSETTIWTPAAGKKFRVMGFCLADGVVTGTVVLKDNTAGTTIFTIPADSVGVGFCSPPMGNGVLSAAANNVLTATGASTQTITGFLYGTEE